MNSSTPATIFPTQGIVPGLALPTLGYGLLVFLLVIAGWGFLFQQQYALWQRLPDASIERFVADRINTPLPPQLKPQALQAACALPVSRLGQLYRSQLRSELAACLLNPLEPKGLPEGQAAAQAQSFYQEKIALQISAAQAWLAAYANQAPEQRALLLKQLHALQTRPAHPLAQFMAFMPFKPPLTQREAVGPNASIDKLANTLRQQISHTEDQLRQIASSPLSAGQQAQELALIATGLQRVTDYGTSPPLSHFSSAHGSLADSLEWIRRAQGYQQRGFSLERLYKLPNTLFATSLILLLVVSAIAWQKGVQRPHGLMIWGAATWLLAMGALMLSDLALTGEPALRYLAERQYSSVGISEHYLDLTLNLPFGNTSLPFWWPLLWVAAFLLLLGQVRDGSSRMLAPVRAWVRWSADVRWSTLQSLCLLLFGCAAVLFLGMAAAISELLILLACIGVASYWARQAAHANSGANLQTSNLLLVLAALALGVGGALARGDLGHALLALVLALCFFSLFGWRWLRYGVFILVAMGLLSLFACWVEQQAVGPLAWLMQILPPHAQDRLGAMFDVWHANSSDLARTRWLMHSAGSDGWGLAYAPWQGLAQAGLQDGLPLQGPSDYVLALLVTLWGTRGGVLLMAMVLAVFASSAVWGLRQALQAGMPPALRWLAAVGGLGCMVMASKVVLSSGGVSGVLPLTGLPVSLLGYGPVTHWAGLAYLVLVWACTPVAISMPVRGIQLSPPPHARGAVRQRGKNLMALVALILLVLWVQVFSRLQHDTVASQHIAQQRHQLAQQLANALVLKEDQAEDSRPAPSLPCPELAAAQQAWNSKLGKLGKFGKFDKLAAWDSSVRLRQATAKPAAPLNAPLNAPNSSKTPSTIVAVADLRLDATRLLGQLPALNARSCRQLARSLGQMLDTDWQRLLGQAPASNSQFQLPRLLAARRADYSTPNPWWGRPGCLWLASALPPAPTQANLPNPSTVATPCAEIPASATWPQWQRELSENAWLQRDLIPQMGMALRHASATTTINHRSVAHGPQLGLTLVPALQQSAQRLADCFTGLHHGNDCEALQPTDPSWRQRYANQPTAIRSGAIGLVLAEVDTGRILALAGALSDCSLRNMGRSAQADARGNMPALRPDASPCAQLPDQRLAWLAQQQPALWLVPPGSALKPLSVLAGIDTQQLAPNNDAYWKSILAESVQRLPIQSTALAAGQHYLDVLGGAGFAQAERELLWGASGQPSHWQHVAYSGQQALRATRMSLAQAETIRQEKQAGINVDKRYGPALMQEFLAARQLADAAVGGGDIRINAIGLVDIWRKLDLRARGLQQAPALHLLEQADQAIVQKKLDWASPAASARVLQLTSGVAASAWKGTAQGSCRIVFGRCPAQGLPGVSGKTGSADFLSAEDGPYVKPGLQIPAKLFGAVFTAADGRRYAIAVMALRIRQGDSHTLELSSSAPAEAALMMMKQMGVTAEK